jgi:hypothetical protein
VAVGFSALETNTTGNNNTAVGNASLEANTTGGTNAAFGRNSMLNNTTGSYNTGLGESSFASNTTGQYNTAVGSASLRSNTTANANTAVGYVALYDNTTGAANTALGYFALTNNTTAQKNVAVGTETLENNITGNFNTGLGTQALRSNTTANNNTAVGYQAGYNNTTSGYNTFIGQTAGYSTTGVGNTFIGCSDNSVGAGYFVTSGTKNTIIGGYHGNQGGLDIRTSSNNIVLSDGDGNPRMRVTSSGQFLFPGSATPNPHTDGTGVQIYGVNGILIGSDNTHAIIAARHGSNGECIRLQRDNTDVGSIDVTTTSTSYNTSSDHRLKENVVDLTGATDRLKQLEPKRFNFIADADTTVDGFLAHEVQTVVPEAISGTHNEVDDEGNPVYQGIDHSKLVPLLVKTIQELEARITALEGA